jgi:hypothetical protein
MKFCLQFLLAAIILIASRPLQVNAHSVDEQVIQSTSNSLNQTFDTSNQKLASFNISNFPTEQKKGNTKNEIAEIEEIEEENETNSSRKYLDDIQYFNSFHYTELLKQYFLYYNNKLSLIKLRFFNSAESSQLLFQVFRI